MLFEWRSSHLVSCVQEMEAVTTRPIFDAASTEQACSILQYCYEGWARGKTCTILDPWGPVMSASLILSR